MQNRTLTKLLDDEKKIYFKIRNKCIWDLFVKQAESEGFLWSNGKNIDEVRWDDLIAMNKNMTFNYLGWAGHMRAYQDKEHTIVIDYAKYINGCENYIYNIKSSLLTLLNNN